MIGVFDSGLGGLYSLQYFLEALPEYDYCYLADSAYAPYGERSADRIRDRTFLCLDWLFDQGCELVIVACNTATAVAIRPRQECYPERKALSVSVPGVEKVIELGLRYIGILATRVTVETNIYQQILTRRGYDIHIEQVVGDGLVGAIESGKHPDEFLDLIVSCTEQFSSDIQGVVLGCTHYPILLPQISQQFPDDLPLINPAAESAVKLVDYLARHPDLATRLSQGKSVEYFTTGNVGMFNELGTRLVGYQVDAQTITIG